MPSGMDLTKEWYLSQLDFPSRFICFLSVDALQKAVLHTFATLNMRHVQSILYVTT